MAQKEESIGVDKLYTYALYSGICERLLILSIKTLELCIANKIKLLAD